jgi:hypothetical protein
MLHGLPPDILRGLLLSVGSHKGTRPLSPSEVAGGLKDAVSAGTSLKDLAATLHLNGPSMLSRFIRLLELPPDVLHLVDWGQTKATIAFTAASELSRLKSHEDQKALAKAAVESELTTTEVKSVVQLHSRSKKPIAECIEAILALRTKVIRRNVFIGGISSPDLVARLQTMRQVERDQLLKSVLGTMLPDYEDVGGRLGHDRFTLAVENESAAKAIMAIPNGFESAIADALAKALETRSVQ